MALIGVLMCFLLFFLASAVAVSPLVRLTHASVMDLGMAGGSEGIVVRGVCSM